MNYSEAQFAVMAVRSVIATYPYDAIEAIRALRRLADLAPHHVKPIVHEAEQAIAKSIEHSGSGYDTVARQNLQQLVTAKERSFLRVVQ